MINQYISGKFSLEDKGKIKDLVDNFEKYKKKLGKKDINQYTIKELETSIARFMDEDAKSKKQLSREEEAKFFKDKEAKLFYEGGGIKVIIPKTEKASCHFRIGTKWCTAGEKNNMFQNYAKRGSLYIIFTKDWRKYQFFFRTQQKKIADETDHMLNTKELNELVKKYPALIDAFEKVAKKTGFLPFIKDLTDVDYTVYAKQDPLELINMMITTEKQLSEKAADEILKANKSYISLILRPSPRNMLLTSS